MQIGITGLAESDGFIIQGGANYDSAGRSVSGAGPQVATTFDATFLYDSSNGRVSYDRDGAGESAAVVYAILNAGLTLAAGDFIIY